MAPTYITITTELPDGSASQRLWEVPADVAERIAEGLGEPNAALVLSPAELTASARLVDQAEFPLVVLREPYVGQ